MKKLINISNHASINWEQSQIEEFGTIVDIPFPVVKANADETDVMLTADWVATKLIKTMEDLRADDQEIYIYLAGEGSLVFILSTIIRNSISRYFHDKLSIFFVFPSTERDMIMIDGRRSYKFKFNKWRIFNSSFVL